MIPVRLWFKFRCGSFLGVQGELPTIPRVGDSVGPTSDDAAGDWIVKHVMHNLYGDFFVEIDIESPEGDELLANMTRRDRIRMRKQLERAGWILVDETGPPLKKCKADP